MLIFGVPRSSRRRRVADTHLSWKTIAPSFSCAQPISPSDLPGQKAPLTLVRRWLCPEITWRWFVTSFTRLLLRSEQGSLSAKVARQVSVSIIYYGRRYSRVPSWNRSCNKTPLDGVSPGNLLVHLTFNHTLENMIQKLSLFPITNPLSFPSSVAPRSRKVEILHTCIHTLRLLPITYALHGMRPPVIHIPPVSVSLLVASSC